MLIIYYDRKQWAALPKDTVVLHQFPRGKITPSISPFCLKLETYLRVAAIPYEVVIVITSFLSL